MTERDFTLMDMCAEINRMTHIGVYYERQKIRIGEKLIYKGKTDRCELILSGMYVMALALEEVEE